MLVLALLITQATPVYELPESPVPPMDMRIVDLSEPTPKIVVTPHRIKRKPVTAEVPRPAPPNPTLLPLVTAKPTPLALPKAESKPAPVAPPAATVPAPPSPPVPPAAARLSNIHKPDKDPPANIATLPFAPSPSAPLNGQNSPQASGEPALGGSRLKGLTPYPVGSMPSGGSGLRGSLVGCANSDAVTLSVVERAKCNERFGGDIAGAPRLDGISPAKRRAFDKAAERQDEDRRYRDSTPRGEPAHPLSSGAGDTSRGPSSVIPSGPPH